MTVHTKFLKRAKEVLELEAEAVRALRGSIDRSFLKALDLMLNAPGRVIVSGMGKTGIIAQKFSATLASTGTPSLYLHCAEAIHGDLGRVTPADVVVLISNSGETQELRQLMPLLKKIGARIIGLTGNTQSSLARYSDVVVRIAVKKEACPLGLAPTSSTTAALAMTDALAVCLLELKGFKEKDFAFFHPGGALGRRLLLKVEDIMRTGKAAAVVKEDETVSAVLLKITNARAGSASIVNRQGKLVGIFTDGDLRRHIETDRDLPRRKIKDVMTKDPLVISADKLAAEAMCILQQKRIDEVPVVDRNKRPVGLLDVQDLLKAGLV